MNKILQTKHLRETLEKIYLDRSKELLFHGWHHIIFVTNKAKIFAESIGADVFFVESAALVHDLNYLVEKNSEPEVAKNYRKEILTNIGYNPHDITRIEEIIIESHTATRSKNISDEGKALSDGDTLFKALPITPILFSGKYIQECDINLSELTNKIISEQNPLLEQGIYFYTNLAKEKYLFWAETNLQLWNNVQKSLEDQDVAEMLETAKKLGVL